MSLNIYRLKALLTHKDMCHHWKIINSHQDNESIPTDVCICFEASSLMREINLRSNDIMSTCMFCGAYSHILRQACALEANLFSGASHFTMFHLCEEIWQWPCQIHDLRPFPRIECQEVMKVIPYVKVFRFKPKTWYIWLLTSRDYKVWETWPMWHAWMAEEIQIKCL